MNAHAAHLDDPQPTAQRFPLQQCNGVRQCGSDWSVGLSAEPKDHNSGVPTGRIALNIGEVQIQCDESAAFQPADLNDARMRRRAPAPELNALRDLSR